jgi:acyl dehydratase
VLSVREQPGHSWEKDGARGGRLWFTSQVVEFSKADAVLVRSTTVVVTTERKIDPRVNDARGDETASTTPPVQRVQRAQDYPVPPVRSGELAVGTCREMLLVDNLTRGQILLYAGASGDFSPQHTDEVWNTKVAGYPSTFAHGMLTMGMTGRLLTDWFGNGRLRRFGLRFARQVWPGDTLTARGAVRSICPAGDPGLAELSVQTVNGRREVVTSGYATVEIAA